MIGLKKLEKKMLSQPTLKEKRTQQFLPKPSETPGRFIASENYRKSHFNSKKVYLHCVGVHKKTSVLDGIRTATI